MKTKDPNPKKPSRRKPRRPRFDPSAPTLDDYITKDDTNVDKTAMPMVDGKNGSDSAESDQAADQNTRTIEYIFHGTTEEMFDVMKDLFNKGLVDEISNIRKISG